MILQQLKFKSMKTLQKVAVAIALITLFFPCQTSAQSDIQKAAIQTYVPPGKLDEFYMFVGNGHSGNVGVYGLPSMRPIVTIPVFTPYLSLIHI